MRCGINRRTTYLQSRNQAEFLRRSVQAASGALRIAGEQYQQAATSFTTVLTAEQKLLQAQNSLAGASANIPFGLDAPIVYLASPWRSAFIRERAAPGCRAQNSTHPGGGCRRNPFSPSTHRRRARQNSRHDRRKFEAFTA